MSDSLRPYGLQPSRLLCPLNSPGKNTGEGYHALLQGIFVTAWTTAHQAPLSMGFFRQEYWRGLPCPPPREYSQPRHQNWVSCLVGRFFTIDPSGKPHKSLLLLLLLSRFSCVRLCATPWTTAFQAPPPMGFSRQKYWSGLPSLCFWGVLFYS